MSELKPCPFCGGKAGLSEVSFFLELMQFECADCGTRFFMKDDIWNHRVYPPEVEQAIERMKPKKIVSTFWSDSSKGFSELHGRFTCPTCNGELDDYRYDISFCPHEGCGQALDWSEE